jgi:acyl carrier protein
MDPHPVDPLAVKARLSRFITHELLNQPARTIADDEDLLGSGLLDSLTVMSLVHHLETELGVEIPPEDVTIDHFVSLAAIDAYVARRTAR